MPDSRKTRDYQPDSPLSLEYFTDPSYHVPAESFGIPMDLGSLDNSARPMDTSGLGIRTGSSLLPEYANPNDDAFKNPLQQISEGLGKIGSALGSDISSAGSGIKDFLSSLVPSQDTMNEIGMRLQNMNAAANGGVPLWMAQQQHQLLMNEHQQGMADKRNALAQKLQQAQQEQQNKQNDDVLKIWQDNNLPMSMKQKLSDQFARQGSVLAQNLGKLGDEHIVSEMGQLQPFFAPGQFEEAQQEMMKPNANLSRVESMVGMARDRQKAFGEHTLKTNRFQELLQDRLNGQLPDTDPRFEEFADLVNQREKRQKESAELDLKLQQMGLSNQKAQLDLNAQQQMPVVGHQVNVGQGTQQTVYDPVTGQRKTYSGEKMQPFEKASNVEVAKALGKDFAGLQDASKNAQVRIAKLDKMSELLKGIQTGKLRPTLNDLYGIAQTFGITLDKTLGRQQAFEALSNELALQARNTSEGNGMPGAMSDADRNYLKNTVPGLQHTPAGNRALINIHKKLAQREIDMAKIARQYIQKHGTLDVGLYDAMQKFSDTHPMFGNPLPDELQKRRENLFK